MPEMSPGFRRLCTSPAYQLVAGALGTRWVLQGRRPAGTGLEIGGGGGALAGRLLSRFPDLRLVVTDDDPEMVAVARRRLAAFGDRAVVERADATALRFPDGGIDLVLSCGMLHHVGRWPAALAEAVRVLRPGGDLLGYDVLDTGPIRRLHGATRGTPVLPAVADSLGKPPDFSGLAPCPLAH